MNKIETDRYTLYLGDCLEIMPTLEAGSVDAVITDPPYGLSFMGKDWDQGVPGVHFWHEAIRVAKPGAFLLAFGGTRTFHRLTCAIEDAGWEIRDCIMWVYGSGFPKSHDVSKAIDREAGKEREVVGTKLLWGHNAGSGAGSFSKNAYEGQTGITREEPITAPATPEATQWQGWGTALKPAWEPIIVARKPLIGTVAQNVLEYGTGAMNIDGCRVETKDNLSGGTYGGIFGASRNPDGSLPKAIGSGDKGRWPANLIHDGSEEVVELFPHTTSGGGNKRSNNSGMWARKGPMDWLAEIDSGSAARFFYCAKASPSDRDGSNHPTMKPTALMRYLCKLVTRPGGVIFDPFMGSGTTGVACAQLGRRFIGIEIDEKYFEIARKRIELAYAQKVMDI